MMVKLNQFTKNRKEVRIGRRKRLEVLLAWVPDGCIGKSIEVDVWRGKHFFFLSIGRRYDGEFWVCKGGH